MTTQVVSELNPKLDLSFERIVDAPKEAGGDGVHRSRLGGLLDD